jgi:hypothetical protein
MLFCTCYLLGISYKWRQVELQECQTPFLHMYVDEVLLGEDSAELVDYPRVELAEHSYSVEAVEH